ncbi:MAG: RDD family protein, partial [Saprospiraceae bacterium]
MEILDKFESQQELPNASEGNRIVAYLIDALLIGAVSIIPIIGLIAGLAYFFTRDALPFLDGQSIGKKAMKIRVVTEDGQHLTNNWGPAIIRSIVFLIP